MLVHYSKRTIAIFIAGLLNCSGLTAATTESAVNGATTISAEPDISVWVDNAPLSLMVNQLGNLSGLEVSIDSDLDGHVSGRYTGSLQDALASLSADHGVLFDLQDDTLRVIDETDSTSVSVALSEHALTSDVEKTFAAMDDTRLGNAVEFREDSVRVSGHPDFVRRTALQITRAIADTGAKKLDATVPPDQEEQYAADVEPLVDAGSQAVLEDIQEQSKPETDRASLSKPIRWVTDIPGFDTF